MDGDTRTVDGINYCTVIMQVVLPPKLPKTVSCTLFWTPPWMKEQGYHKARSRRLESGAEVRPVVSEFGGEWA